MAKYQAQEMRRPPALMTLLTQQSILFDVLSPIVKPLLHILLSFEYRLLCVAQEFCCRVIENAACQVIVDAFITAQYHLVLDKGGTPGNKVG